MLKKHDPIRKPRRARRPWVSKTEKARGPIDSWTAHCDLDLMKSKVVCGCFKVGCSHRFRRDPDEGWSEPEERVYVHTLYARLFMYIQSVSLLFKGSMLPLLLLLLLLLLNCCVLCYFCCFLPPPPLCWPSSHMLALFIC